MKLSLPFLLDKGIFYYDFYCLPSYFYEMLVTWETKTLKLVYNTISKREIRCKWRNVKSLNLDDKQEFNLSSQVIIHSVFCYIPRNKLPREIIIRHEHAKSTYEIDLKI